MAILDNIEYMAYKPFVARPGGARHPKDLSEEHASLGLEKSFLFVFQKTTFSGPYCGHLIQEAPPEVCGLKKSTPAKKDNW